MKEIRSIGTTSFIVHNSSIIEENIYLKITYLTSNIAFISFILTMRPVKSN